MTALLREAFWILDFIVRAFLHILPFLALSVPLAVLLKRSGASKRIEGFLRGNPVISVVAATVIGAVSPFCSCGVVPVIAALLTGGVPLAPVMSFWLASPSMDPEIFFLSAGAIGWELAIWRLAATFVISLSGGFITLALERAGAIGGNVLRLTAPIARASATLPLVMYTGGKTSALVAPSALAAPSTFSALAVAAEGPSCGCACASRPGIDIRGIARDTGNVLLKLAGYMGIAFLLEALISRFVPQELVAGALGRDTVWAVPLATLIGIPFYTTNLSALGIVSGLLARGMSGAAALSFLIGGAVTTLPAMSAVWGIVKPRIFALYLGFCAGGALLAGFAYQLARALGATRGAW
jgi:uncharacterized membrane protein YraQ (UPF0718 family)